MRRASRHLHHATAGYHTTSTTRIANGLPALLLAGLFAFLAVGVIQAQVITTGSLAPYNGGNGVSGNGVITFGVTNNSGGDILLTDLESYWQTASNGANTTLWATTVTLGGPYFPFVATDWTVIGTGTNLSVPANGIHPTITGMTYLIPDGGTVRFLLESDQNIRYSGTGTISPNTFTVGGISLHCGDFTLPGATGIVGYGGLFTNGGNNPRYFTGTLTFLPATPCTGTPVAGTIAGPSFVCENGTADLVVNGSTVGAGITRDWYSSTTSGGPYTTFVGSGTTVNTGPVTMDTYYVCTVTCTTSGQAATTAEFHLPVTPGVSGSYTINDDGTGDLLNFSEAAALLSCGVSGPVVFNVAAGSGPYADRLVLGEILGASATNTITFNANDVILVHAPTVSADRAAVLLNGADHVTIEDLIIDVAGGTFGYGVHLTNQADHNTIRGCRIFNPDNTTSSNYGGIVASASLINATTAGNNANHTIIEDNVILGCSGAYKLRLNGASATARAVGNVVRNNQFRNGYNYQVYLNFQDSALVQGNEISRPGLTSTTTFYGIYVNNSVRTTVDGNVVNNVGGTGTAYLYYITASDPVPGQENTFQNNVAFRLNNTGTNYGMYNSSSNNTRYYHNSLLLDDQNTTTGVTYGFYQTTLATGLEYRNNIVKISRTGTGTKRCMHFATATSVFTSDNNVLVMASTGGTTNQVGYLSTGYATLANWQAAGYDPNSSSADPLFVSNTDLTPMNVAINDIGDPGIGALVPLDYNGTPRPLGIAPDPGAIEFGMGTDVPSVAPTPSEWSVNPNPATDQATLRSREGHTGEWTLMDLGGRVVLRGAVIGEVDIPVGGLSTGTYVLDVRDGATFTRMPLVVAHAMGQPGTR
ncbi:MAG: right-handed parallel beta-helix repeat-containing protein [Flavobacteriales bacterium]|nr:right-handed parallel beta-helix repeat-containing protein [Flavobacteriales bacterium]